MIKVWDLPKGEGFLPKISIENLKRRYEEEEKAKPKLRLLCAIHRKEGKSIDEIADSTNMKRRTVHDILHRFVERGVDAKDGIKQGGRPPKLTVRQRRKLIAKLEHGPSHNEVGLWTTKNVHYLIQKEFGVKYHQKYVWELLTAAGFSVQRPRPKNYQAPSEKEVAHFKKRLQCWRNITGKKAL